METLTAPCSLCPHWEAKARWRCHDENESGNGEGLHMSWCQCHCQLKLPEGSLLRAHWALFQPGHHWSHHLLPFRTIYRYRCGPHWKLCWITCYCLSVQSKGNPTAGTKRSRRVEERDRQGCRYWGKNRVFKTVICHLMYIFSLELL